MWNTIGELVAEPDGNFVCLQEVRIDPFVYRLCEYMAVDSRDVHTFYTMANIWI